MADICERQIDWHPKNRKLIQIPKNGLEYAFVSDDYRQIHQLVWCKDFMQDAVYGQVNQKPVTIYGFKYDPAVDPPLNMEKTRIMVTSWRDANFGSKICNNCLEFLRGVESHLKMRKTTVEKCSGAPATYKKAGVWLLDGSKRWMKSPPMLSLYTMLIRIGLVHNVGDSFKKTIRLIKSGELKPYNWKEDKIDHKGSVIHYDNDRDFLRKGNRGLVRILKHGDRKLFFSDIANNYPENNKRGYSFSTYDLHDRCGLVGFSKKETASEFPYWHRLDKA
jgi:hypothetical protein